MANTFFDKIYKSKTQQHVPDVLSCLANLSNDEVFTPPDVVNKMLDLLPQELFSNPNTKFLDPACKTGVFLREIAKRLLVGLEDKIPDLQERIGHIFHKQLYGIAITELTSLLSRRSLYCSKYPNGPYSITKFENPEGNIRFRRINHAWVNGKCKYCGVSKKTVLGDENRKNELETHAYEWIHLNTPEDIWNMKFDVIISNPPYQLKVNDSGKGLGAIPIYHKFFQQAQKLHPQYISMIIPDRWFSGGVGLEDFRKNMLNDKHLNKIVDFSNANDCFPGVDLNGGVCYFLYDSLEHSLCDYTNINNGKINTCKRKLNEFDIFIRSNEALSIVDKILSKSEKMLNTEGGCSPQTPYGFLSTYTGNPTKIQEDDCQLLSSKGWSYVRRRDVKKSVDTIDMYKPMISKLSCEHAGAPDKAGMYRVLSRMEILKPSQICNQSYLTICPTLIESEAKNIYGYLRTKFVRFLILQTLIGMNLSISNFKFVPWVDFSKSWTDNDLYKKYQLTNAEIEYIENTIRPMELSGGDN